MNNDTTETKTCTKCKKTFPATTEYFHVAKKQSSGLYPQCKVCRAEVARTFYQANKDKKRKQLNEYKQLNQEKVRKQGIEYRQANREKIREKGRQYYYANKEQMDEYSREYRKANPEKIRKLSRDHHRANPEKSRVNKLRYRARKQTLPDSFTEAQWIACLEYFGYSCAVCGISFENATPHADHWIPLYSDECPGTIATNIVCLCGVCNKKKWAIMPDIWIKREYDVDKANEILQRIEDYFKWVLKSL